MDGGAMKSEIGEARAERTPYRGVGWYRGIR
jgi:hypothetical protein